jgi:uncharacterized protein YpmS
MTSVTLIHPSPPVFFGIDNKENLNIWKFIAVVLNILWSLFLIKLTLTRILHMEMKIYSEEAKKGQRVFKVNEFKHSDILK